MPAASRSATTLFGRAAELAGLRAALDDAADGRGGVVIVEGEAGIGKTTLVERAMRDARIPVLRGGARQMEALQPFAIACDLLGVSRSADGSRRAEIAAMLGDGRSGAELTSDGWAGVEFRVTEALLVLLDELTGSAPAVLVVEDVHWADAASVRWLARLTRAPGPVLVIATVRPHPHAAELAALLKDWRLAGAHSWTLRPLGEHECVALGERMVGATLGPGLRALVARAGGNPLFVGEVIAGLLADGGVLVRADGSAEIPAGGPIPSLPAAIRTHLSTLEPPTLQLLSVAAVLGASFSLVDLGALTGLPVAALWLSVSEAVTAGVLREDGEQLAFRHDLIHDALYADLPTPVRAALHADAARILELSGASAGPVAQHVLRSQSLSSGPQAVARLRRAALDAAAGAPSVAVDLLEAALAMLARSDPLWVELRAELALALVASSRLSEAEVILRAVLQRGAPPQRDAALRGALMQALMQQGRQLEAYEVAAEAAQLEALSPVDRVRFAAMAAIGPAFRGDLDSAESAALAAETQAQAVGDQPGEIRALLAQAHVQSFRGFAVHAADLAARALELATADGTRQAFEGLPHAVLSLMLTQCDRVDEAGVVAEASRSVCEEFGMAGGLVWAHLAASYGLFIAGRWDDSCAAATAGLALAAETGTAWQADSLCVLALVDSRRGRPEIAWEHLSHAEGLVDAGEATYRPGWLAWARSVLEADRRRLDAALECLVPVWEQALGSGSVAEVRNYGPHLIRLAHASGRTELAEQVTASIEAQADANPAVGSLQASAQAMRGLLTDDADLLLDALELFRASPRRYEHARCAEAAASALLRAGRQPEAREAGQECLAILSDLGAGAELARARAALRSAGLRLGVRGRRGRPTNGWAALTETEARVARLVATRMSNPEVAAAMFLSRRTVACHVSAVLGKLGMTSRTELASAALRGSLEDL